MQYADLFVAVKSYVENDFPNTTFSDPTQLTTAVMTSTQQVNTFIREAEQRIFNSVQLLDLRKNVVGDVAIGVPYLTVPCDWLANFSMAVIDPVSGAYDYLLNKDVNFIREAFPIPTMTGKPSHYAFFDQNAFLLGPTPDQPYSIELHYFYYPTSIVDTTDGHSWLGDHFDSALLYGALLEAYTFMKGEADVVKIYQDRYNEAMTQLKLLGEGKNRQDSYRAGQNRMPVQ